MAARREHELPRVPKTAWGSCSEVPVETNHPTAASRTLRRVCFVLESARRDGHDPAAVIDESQEALDIAGTTRADAVKVSLLRNLDILGKLGCLEPAGMAKLETSNAPTITRGPYAGDIASVDHITPRSVAEELDERLYNLEFMPSRMNTSKGNRVTQRQVQLARRWHKAGLLNKKAGYASRGNAADVGASKLVRNPKVAEALERERLAGREASRLTRDEKLRILEGIARDADAPSRERISAIKVHNDMTGEGETVAHVKVSNGTLDSIKARAKEIESSLVRTFGEAAKPAIDSSA